MLKESGIIDTILCDFANWPLLRFEDGLIEVNINTSKKNISRMTHLMKCLQNVTNKIV